MILDSWFIEEYGGTVGAASFRIFDVLYEGRSDYQEVKVLHNPFFGNVLLLDDLVMLTQKDEFYYHDMLVHVPLMCVQNPESVLIIGGGDGGSVREVLKHNSIKRVVLCEIDQMVIDVSRDFFPSISSALDDSRCEIFVGDGIEYVKNHPNEFDCIMIDSTDPVGPAVGLFTPEFYVNVRTALKSGGVMSAQSESPAWRLDDVAGIVRNIKQSFDNARLYLCPIPCYPSGLWSFTISFKDGGNPVVFDEERAAVLTENCVYYNADVHRAAFALPNFIKKALT
jgi:spermidine synthase